MENKTLNNSELENVYGGQAVLPLLSNEENDIVVGVNRFKLCDSCGSTVAVPPTGHGTCKCKCGASVKY